MKEYSVRRLRPTEVVIHGVSKNYITKAVFGERGEVPIMNSPGLLGKRFFFVHVLVNKKGDVVDVEGMGTVKSDVL